MGNPAVSWVEILENHLDGRCDSWKSMRSPAKWRFDGEKLSALDFPASQITREYSENGNVTKENVNV